MSVTLTVAGDTLRVQGVVAFDNADAVCADGLGKLAGMPATVTLDLDGLESAGTVTVAVMLRWARALAERGGRLQLRQVPSQCRAILKVSGLADALPEIN